MLAGAAAFVANGKQYQLSQKGTEDLLDMKESSIMGN
jgi:hypothetical protein